MINKQRLIAELFCTQHCITFSHLWCWKDQPRVEMSLVEWSRNRSISKVLPGFHHCYCKEKENDVLFFFLLNARGPENRCNSIGVFKLLMVIQNNQKEKEKNVMWSMREKSQDPFTAVCPASKHFSNENGIQNIQSTFDAKIIAIYFSKARLQNVLLIHELYICRHMIIENISGNIKQRLTW